MTYDLNIQKFNFDCSRFDFLNLVKSFVCKSPKLRNISSLQDILKYTNSNEVSLIEQLVYDCFHSTKFQKIYHDFNCEILRPIFGKNFAFQQIPSIRIVFPEAKSVNFHNDVWYGHGKEIINIWLPLTNVRQSQCLAFLSTRDNEEALKYFYDQEPSLVEIQNYCEKRARHLELDYGQFAMFPTKVLHGTTHNTSREIRVSFDFRLCFDNDYGLKNKNFFKFTDKDLNSNSKKSKNCEFNVACIGYLNQKSIFDNFVISQTIQQEAIVSYCKKNQLNLLALETELIGFTKSLNLEDIIFGNRKNLAKNIVFFSDKLLDRRNIENTKIVKKALEKDIIFHFVNEGYTLKNGD